MLQKNCIDILLVEDSESDAETIKRVLRRHLKQASFIHNASTIKEAREILEESTLLPDIILLDLGLPDTIGKMDTYESLKSANTIDIPTIILTCLNDHELAVSMIGEGAEDYVKKSNISNDPKELCQAIEFALSRRKNMERMYSPINDQIEEKEMIINYMSGSY